MNIPGSRLILDDTDRARLPVARWSARVPGVPLLLEHSRGSYLRPGLRGHRLEPPGRDWSTAFTPTGTGTDGATTTLTADDPAAGLGLRTELEQLPGGALRIRHVLTNTGATPYVVDGLEVTVPVPDDHTELLDFTGRHEGERVPQRGAIADGLWLRESRGGRPGLDSATLLVAGTPGFGFGAGRVLAMAVATSGNSVLGVQRDLAGPAALLGGELLLPGEVVLDAGESYATPWVFVLAGDEGLDGLAAALHTWQRSLPAHPARQPVTLNTWEAVYFATDLDKLRRLADRAAQVGAERFVLDDGWFRHRRNARAGLGDWHVDEGVWPHGLGPLVEHVRGLGLEFGLWFEPEMVNPDSDLYRAHPDWVLRAGDRVPLLQRNQLVLDLTDDGAWQYVFERVDAILTAYPIGYVKWDHNRPLLEAGSPARGGRPAVHAQTAAFERLLDALRAAHPEVAFESCASGGGRIDLAVIERVQRVWTSDLTDALARQRIQRWTAQLLAPEYLGAHVSAPTSHQTGRTFSLDFRAATALFGAFGIEWDLTAATEEELTALAGWVELHKQWRDVLHTGRVVRMESSDLAVWGHGVVAADRRRALFAHVQLDESVSNRGAVLRPRGLDPDTGYRARWVGPVAGGRVSGAPAPDPVGPAGEAVLSGSELARDGLWFPRRRPEQVLLFALEAAD
ncbi:MAG TPA: alpha-galactosidase [Jatrophihabitans sp.]|nr:alpha-galactosidase [Jatrophihabitans sp.]